MEMKIKPTMKYHFTSISMVKIQRRLTKQLSVRMWSNLESSYTLGRIVKYCNHFWQFLRAKHSYSITVQIHSCKYTCKRMKTCPHKKLIQNVYCRSIPNSQKVDVTHQPMNGWINVIYKGIFSGHKNKWYMLQNG